MKVRTSILMGTALTLSLVSGCSSEKETGAAPKSSVPSTLTGSHAGAPGTVEAQATALARDGKVDEGLALLRKALSERPEDLQLHRAYQDVMRAKPDAGPLLRSEYQALLDAHPKSALFEYLFGRGVMFDAPADAESAFNEAIQLDPKFQWSYMALGVLRTQRGDHLSAVQIYEKGIAQIPDSASLYYNLAEAHFGIGNYRGALEAAQKNLSLEPDNPPSLEIIGRIQLAQGALDEAEESFRKALAGNPDLIQSNLGLADVLARAGKVEEARPFAQKAIDAGYDLPLPLKEVLKMK